MITNEFFPPLVLLPHQSGNIGGNHALTAAKRKGQFRVVVLYLSCIHQQLRNNMNGGLCASVCLLFFEIVTVLPPLLCFLQLSLLLLLHLSTNYSCTRGKVGVESKLNPETYIKYLTKKNNTKTIKRQKEKELLRAVELSMPDGQDRMK